VQRRTGLGVVTPEEDGAKKFWEREYFDGGLIKKGGEVGLKGCRGIRKLVTGTTRAEEG
jgi:hypothetical protein